MKTIDINGWRPRLLHPYSFVVALCLSLAFGSIHTGLMLLGNVYNAENNMYAGFHLVALFIFNIMLYLVLFLLSFQVMKKPWSTVHRFHVAVISTVVITALYTLLSQQVSKWIYDSPLQYLDIIKDALGALTVILTLVLLFFITRRQQTLLENEHLKAENLQVRLTSLENQVDPHFLFNSLNTLDGLIGMDDERAHEYLHQLATTYRYIIRQQHIVELAEELDFAKSYVYLMQIRYGHNLQVEWHIDADKMAMKVLPISLQLLIENAIKHNVVSDRHPLNIIIETTADNTLVVRNHLCKMEDEQNGSGIGLANLNNRYQLIAHKDISIMTDDDVFAVEIPLIP